MKIITPRNNKDFYDYLTGIYGIDEKVVFDRRVFNVLKSSDSPLFSSVRRKEDRKRSLNRYFYDVINDKKFDRPVGDILNCLLEAGNHWYVFQVERYLDDAGKVHLDWGFIKKYVVDKNMHSGETPLTLFLFPNLNSYRRDESPLFIKKHYLRNGIANPIIKDTPITSFVKADDVYQGIYAFISSLNDIDYTDNRNDIQKLESAGFDKKTSFRKIK